MAQRKLTDEQVMDIRNSTAPVAILAQKYGLAESTVHRVKRGEGYAHLPGAVSASKGSPVQKKLAGISDKYKDDLQTLLDKLDKDAERLKAELNELNQERSKLQNILQLLNPMAVYVPEKAIVATGVDVFAAPAKNVSAVVAARPPERTSVRRLITQVLDSSMHPLSANQIIKAVHAIRPAVAEGTIRTTLGSAFRAFGNRGAYFYTRDSIVVSLKAQQEAEERVG